MGFDFKAALLAGYCCCCCVAWAALVYHPRDAAAPRLRNNDGIRERERSFSGLEQQQPCMHEGRRIRQVHCSTWKHGSLIPRDPGETVGCCNDMLFDKILTRCSTPPTHLQSQYL